MDIIIIVAECYKSLNWHAVVVINAMSIFTLPVLFMWWLPEIDNSKISAEMLFNHLFCYRSSWDNYNLFRSLQFMLWCSGSVISKGNVWDSEMEFEKLIINIMNIFWYFSV